MLIKLNFCLFIWGRLCILVLSWAHLKILKKQKVYGHHYVVLVANNLLLLHWPDIKPLCLAFVLSECCVSTAAAPISYSSPSTNSEPAQITTFFWSSNAKWAVEGEKKRVMMVMVKKTPGLPHLHHCRISPCPALCWFRNQWHSSAGHQYIVHFKDFLAELSNFFPQLSTLLCPQEGESKALSMLFSSWAQSCDISYHKEISTNQISKERFLVK